MRFELRFSDKEITAWGGMGVMKRMLDHLGLNAALEACGLPQPGSNRGYSPVQLITQFKELKYDFAADSFNMKDFWATEATLNTVMLAYNLMRLLRQVVLKTSTVKHTSNTVQHTLQTLRYKLFAKPAYITTESRKPILHLAIAMQERAWMQGLWDAAKSFDLPAHFSPVYSP